MLSGRALLVPAQLHQKLTKFHLDMVDQTNRWLPGHTTVCYSAYRALYVVLTDGAPGQLRCWWQTSHQRLAIVKGVKYPQKKQDGLLCNGKETAKVQRGAMSLLFG